MSKLRDMGLVKFDADDPAHIAWRERLEVRITAPRGVMGMFGAAPLRMRVVPSPASYDANELPDAPAVWDEIDKMSGMSLEAFVDAEAEPLDATVADVD